MKSALFILTTIFYLSSSWAVEKKETINRKPASGEFGCIELHLKDSDDRRDIGRLISQDCNTDKPFSTYLRMFPLPKHFKEDARIVTVCCTAK